MKRIISTTCLILVLICAFGKVSLSDDSKEILKAIKIFPSEENINEEGFRKATHFSFSDNSIFISDMIVNVVLVYELDGNYKFQIGKPGQGPGEFENPSYISYYKGKIYVSDRGNQRFQVFSENGTYEITRNLLRFTTGLSITDDKIIAISPTMTANPDMNTPLFHIMNLKGDIIKTFKGYLSDRYNSMEAMLTENHVTIRAIRQEFHMLQYFGDIYRIFDSNGNKKKQIKLERNPMKSNYYKEKGYKLGYPTFDINVDNGDIYAQRIAEGSIDVDVFNNEGKYIKTYQCKLDKNETYYAGDMKYMKRNGKIYFYFLLKKPESVVVISRIE